MDPLYLRKLLINKQLKQETVQTHKTDRAESVNVNESTEINVAKQAENLVREMREEMLHPRRDLKMNYLASMERSSYVKKVMNLPKTLPELLMQLQNEDSIADDMPQMYYQQNKQKQENLKSDIREGVIRNAKESFEETLNKGVNNNRHSEPTGEESQKPQKPNVNVENKPNIPPQRPNVNQEVKPDVPQTKPNVDNKPNMPDPPHHSEPTGEESQRPQQKPNVNVENKPNIPPQKPNVNQEVKPDVPQTRPNVENKPNTPQPPHHSEPTGEESQKPQQKPNVNQEVKTDVPQTKPNIENKPNTPQPPRHSEPTGEESQKPQQRPNLNQEVKPNVPQTKPNVDNKPNMPDPPRHSEFDSESNKPTQPKPNVEIKPNIPQQKPNVNQEVKPDVPQQRPNINQEIKPDVPQTKPNVYNKPNMPDPPRHSEPTGEESQRPQQKPNVNVENKPNIPPQRPNMPVQPNQKPEIRPMYSPDDMLRQYENNELWQPNRNHGVHIAENKPNMPPRPPMNEGIRPEPMPQPKPPMNEGIKPEPMPQPRPPMNDGIRPEPMPQPRPPMNEGLRPEPMPQPRPPMNEGIRPEPMPRPRPPMNEGIRPEPMPQPRPPMNEGIRPEPMPQPRPPMNEGIRPEPMPRPLPPHKPIAPPHHQHPEHVDVKPDLPGFKPDIGLQEYMRYEMLRPQPLQPPPNTSISSEVHRHHHHHKHLPPPEKEISQETQAAMNVMQNVQQPAEPTVTQMRQKLSGDAAELFFTGLINLNDLSNTLKTNSKGAKAKLVLAMANASKHGIDNSQINDTLKMISASMAATETSTPSKVLKNIIELYLPWYPLQQGVGFDLSIETKAGEQDFLSVLKVWIQTRNYGNVNAILTLMTSNSVDMSIQCSEKFPKDDLLKRLNEETKNRTMQSNINVEEFEQTEGYIEPQQQAKVSLSSTYEMNPYLLLMAHSFIKNTIVIDSNMLFS